jgi:hypothetical protein
MLRNEKEDNGFSLKLFNPKNCSEIEALYADIDSEIAQSEEKITPQIRSKMVDWLKKYVNSPDFLNSYEQWLELMAVATFWSVKLGLEPFLAKLSDVERQEFHPLCPGFFANAERTKLIYKLLEKLSKPPFVGQAIHGLELAADCVYVHYNSFEKFQEQNKHLCH